MKLTTEQVHEAVLGLNTLDQDDIKLVPDVILSVAINLNKLKPFATAYERARARALAQIHAANRALPEKDRRSIPELEADFADADLCLRNGDEEVEVRTIMRSDLRLADNPKIRGVTMARLMPLLTGLE